MFGNGELLAEAEPLAMVEDEFAFPEPPLMSDASAGASPSSSSLRTKPREKTTTKSKLFSSSSSSSSSTSSASSKRGSTTNAADETSSEGLDFLYTMKEVEGVIEQSRRRFLDARSILILLDLGAKGEFRVLNEVQQRPASGSLFLYDRTETPGFRVDGHSYIKKKGKSLAVREDHVKLKFGQENRVYACHVHSDACRTFHRRSYWDLKQESGLVLVHFLDTNAGGQVVHESNCLCIACSKARNDSMEASILNPISLEESIKSQTGKEKPEFDDFLKGIDFSTNMEDLDMLNFVEDGMNKNQLLVQSSLKSTLADSASLVVEDFAPNRINAGGETKMMFSLQALPGKSGIVSKACFSSSNLVEVNFGSQNAVPAEILSSGALTCVAPSMPLGTRCVISVTVDGKPLAMAEKLDSRVRFDLCSGRKLPRHSSTSSSGDSSFVISQPQRMQEPASMRSSGQTLQVKEEFPVAPMAALPIKVEIPPVDPRRILKRKRSKKLLLSPLANEAKVVGSDGDFKEKTVDLEARDVDQLDDDELTELSEALLERVVKVLVNLCKEEKDLVGEVDALDEQGFSLLHYAVSFNHERLVALLLDHNANPNTKTSTGDSPLHLAAEAGLMNISWRLIKAGADPEVKDANGQTCSDLAIRYAHTELGEMLRTVKKARSWRSESTMAGFAGSDASSVSVSSSPGNSFSEKDFDRASAKESFEDKQQKMMREAFASMSIIDRCAMHLGMRDSMDSMDVDFAESMSLQKNAGTHLDTPKSGEMHNRERIRSMEASPLKHDPGMKKLISEHEPDLIKAMSALNEKEREELEKEASIIQMNFRRWMLRRSVLATRKVEDETSGFIAEKNHESADAKSVAAPLNEETLKKVQALGKGYLARQEFKRAKNGVMRVQANTRRYLAQKHFQNWRRQLSASLLIQRSVREYQRRQKEAEL